MKTTKTVYAGNVAIGGGHRVTVQSMLNIPLTQTEAALHSIRLLEEEGCEIIRASVPDEDAAEAIKIIAPQMHVPLVADIHFNHRLAIASVKNGVAKLRINPGNIGGKEKIKEVCSCLKDYGIPVRIGINGGSVEKDILSKYGHVCAEALVESAERSIAYFNEFDYDNIVVSIKASDVPTTYAANKLFSSKYDYPLHLGITEAGASMSGMVRSAAGIGALLLEGIGDTIRVSLTGDPVQEVTVGKELLCACGLRNEGVHIVSCPTCARCKTDTLSIVNFLKEHTGHIKQPVTAAVMGCVVNGPGESKEADVGVACGDGKAALFKNGEIYKTIKTEDIAQALLDEIESIAQEKGKAEK